MNYRIIQHLQNSPLTGWLWNYWQHGETGRICMLPIWKRPGSRYQKWKYPKDPPVDNAHVAQGCQQFGAPNDKVERRAPSTFAPTPGSASGGKV